MPKYVVTISFDSDEELSKFIKKLEPEPTEPLMVKKSLRGSKTKDLHKLAKEYKGLNPSLQYKECLKIAGSIIKNKNKIEKLA